MIAAAQTIPSESPAATAAQPDASSAGAWSDMRNDADLQFAPVDIPEITPPKPNWFERLLADVFAWFADVLAPLGSMLGGVWWWLQWVLLALLAVFVLLMLARMFGADAGARRGKSAAAQDETWQPDHAASLALLEDADRLAADGRFDEATRLLLQRSVGQIAAVRPDWVEPSSTARELAALPALPDAARAAFRVIAERVERSLFALTALERADWEAARAAYAEFALARFGGRERAA